jgi:hypothetical protein
MVRSFSKVQHSSLAARAVAAALFKFSWLGEQERTFFKVCAVGCYCYTCVIMCHVVFLQVIAASALVISEACSLLEMAELAWDYAASHTTASDKASQHLAAVNLLQVIAASALVISEARALLEMAEPAWDYAAYHSIWAITAEDYELEGRLKALEVKVGLFCCSTWSCVLPCLQLLSMVPQPNTGPARNVVTEV